MKKNQNSKRVHDVEQIHSRVRSQVDSRIEVVCLLAGLVGDECERLLARRLQAANDLSNKISASTPKKLLRHSHPHIGLHRQHPRHVVPRERFTLVVSKGELRSTSSATVPIQLPTHAREPQKTRHSTSSHTTRTPLNEKPAKTRSSDNHRTPLASLAQPTDSKTRIRLPEDPPLVSENPQTSGLRSGNSMSLTSDQGDVPLTTSIGSRIPVQASLTDASLTSSAMKACNIPPVAGSGSVTELVRDEIAASGKGSFPVQPILDSGCAGIQSDTKSPLTSSASTSSPFLNNTTITTSPPLGGDASSASGATTPAAFFASPTGKGTIAGISLGSSALVVILFFFFIWRNRRDTDSEDRRNLRTDSVSSFGSTTSLGVIERHPQPQMATGTGMQEVRDNQQERNRGSFFVENRRYGTEAANNSLSRYGFGSGTIPAAAFTGAAAITSSRPAHLRQALSEENIHDNYESERSGEDTSFAYQQPSSDGHRQDAYGKHASLLAYAQPPLAGPIGAPQRRASGYMSDTYRSRRSRPLSVRNPDSDEDGVIQYDPNVNADARTPSNAVGMANGPEMFLVSPSANPMLQQSQIWRPWQTPASFSDQRGPEPPMQRTPVAPVHVQDYAVHNHDDQPQSRPYGVTQVASSHSSPLWRADDGLGGSSRPWDEGGRHTPQDIQDVQLGSNSHVYQGGVSGRALGLAGSAGYNSPAGLASR